VVTVSAVKDDRSLVPAPVEHNGIDQEAVLRHLGLNPRDVHTQALLAICRRYGLDPLLKHVVLIQGRPYITRDGYLSVAHASRQLDGIEVIEEGEDTNHWWAKVAVYRKDMSRPFAYRGRYPKEGSGNKQYGPEMAVKCAEVACLRRAFNVTGAVAADERWDAPEQVVDADSQAPDDPEQWFRDSGWADGKVAHDAYRADSVVLRNSLNADARAQFRDWMEDHDHALNRGNPRDEAEAIRKKLVELRENERVLEPETGEMVPVDRPPDGPSPAP
jgi:hypothetical protein